MAKPINLRQARKARDRAAKASRADANAARFGRTKTERALQDSAATRASKNLDGHKRDRADDE